MTTVLARIVLLVAVALSLTACGSGPERQWYKPGRNYSVAEFERDQADCTKNKVLDEECMTDRGWVAISADQDKGPPPMQGGGTPSKTRVAPK